MATELTEELKEQQENLGGNIIDNDLDTDNLVLDEDSISSATDEYNTELEEDVETGENIPTDTIPTLPSIKELAPIPTEDIVVEPKYKYQGSPIDKQTLLQFLENDDIIEMLKQGSVRIDIENPEFDEVQKKLYEEGINLPENLMQQGIDKGLIEDEREGTVDDFVFEDTVKTEKETAKELADSINIESQEDLEKQAEAQAIYSELQIPSLNPEVPDSTLSPAQQQQRLFYTQKKIQESLSGAQGLEGFSTDYLGEEGVGESFPTGAIGPTGVTGTTDVVEPTGVEGMVGATGPVVEPVTESDYEKIQNSPLGNISFEEVEQGIDNANQLRLEEIINKEGKWNPEKETEGTNEKMKIVADELGFSSDGYEDYVAPSLSEKALRQSTTKAREIIGLEFNDWIIKKNPQQIVDLQEEILQASEDRDEGKITDEEFEAKMEEVSSKYAKVYKELYEWGLDNGFDERQRYDNAIYNEYQKKQIVPAVEQNIPEGIKEILKSVEFMSADPQDKRMMLYLAIRKDMGITTKPEGYKEKILDNGMMVSAIIPEEERPVREEMMNYERFMYPSTDLVFSKGMMKQVLPLLEELKETEGLGWNRVSKSAGKAGTVREVEYNKTILDAIDFAEEVIAMPMAKEGNTWYGKNMWKGMWQKKGEAIPFVGGLFNLSQTLRIKKIYEKVQNGEDLNDEEKILYKIAGIYNSYKQMADPGFAYIAGEHSPMAAAFIAELILTSPLSATTRIGGAKYLTKAAYGLGMKSFAYNSLDDIAKTGIRHGINTTDDAVLRAIQIKLVQDGIKGTGNLGKMATRNFISLLTSFPKGVYINTAHTINRTIQETMPSNSYYFDTESQQAFEKLNEAANGSIWNAALKNYLLNTAEVYSEQFGEDVLRHVGKAGLQYLKNPAINKYIAKMWGISEKSADYIRKLSLNPQARKWLDRMMFNHLAKKMQMFKPSVNNMMNGMKNATKYVEKGIRGVGTLARTIGTGSGYRQIGGGALKRAGIGGFPEEIGEEIFMARLEPIIRAGFGEEYKDPLVKEIEKSFWGFENFVGNTEVGVNFWENLENYMQQEQGRPLGYLMEEAIGFAKVLAPTMGALNFIGLTKGAYDLTRVDEKSGKKIWQLVEEADILSRVNTRNLYNTIKNHDKKFKQKEYDDIKKKIEGLELEGHKEKLIRYLDAKQEFDSNKSLKGKYKTFKNYQNVLSKDSKKLHGDILKWFYEGAENEEGLKEGYSRIDNELQSDETKKEGKEILDMYQKYLSDKSKGKISELVTFDELLREGTKQAFGVESALDLALGFEYMPTDMNDMRSIINNSYISLSEKKRLRAKINKIKRLSQRRDELFGKKTEPKEKTLKIGGITVSYKKNNRGFSYTIDSKEVEDVEQAFNDEIEKKKDDIKSLSTLAEIVNDNSILNKNDNIRESLNNKIIKHALDVLEDTIGEEAERTTTLDNVGETLQTLIRDILGKTKIYFNKYMVESDDVKIGRVNVYKKLTGIINTLIRNTAKEYTDKEGKVIAGKLQEYMDRYKTITDYIRSISPYTNVFDIQAVYRTLNNKFNPFIRKQAGGKGFEEIANAIDGVLPYSEEEWNKMIETSEGLESLDRTLNKLVRENKINDEEAKVLRVWAGFNGLDKSFFNNMEIFVFNDIEERQKIISDLNYSGAYEKEGNAFHFVDENGKSNIIIGTRQYNYIQKLDTYKITKNQLPKWELVSNIQEEIIHSILEAKLGREILENTILEENFKQVTGVERKVFLEKMQDYYDSFTITEEQFINQYTREKDENGKSLPLSKKGLYVRYKYYSDSIERLQRRKRKALSVATTQNGKNKINIRYDKLIEDAKEKLPSLTNEQIIKYNIYRNAFDNRKGITPWQHRMKMKSVKESINRIYAIYRELERKGDSVAQKQINIERATYYGTQADEFLMYKFQTYLNTRLLDISEVYSTQNNGFKGWLGKIFDKIATWLGKNIVSKFFMGLISGPLTETKMRTGMQDIFGRKLNKNDYKKISKIFSIVTDKEGFEFINTGTSEQGAWWNRKTEEDKKIEEEKEIKQTLDLKVEFQNDNAGNIFFSDAIMALESISEKGWAKLERSKNKQGLYNTKALVQQLKNNGAQTEELDWIGVDEIAKDYPFMSIEQFREFLEYPISLSEIELHGQQELSKKQLEQIFKQNYEDINNETLITDGIAHVLRLNTILQTESMRDVPIGSDPILTSKQKQFFMDVSVRILNKLFPEISKEELTENMSLGFPQYWIEEKILPIIEKRLYPILEDKITGVHKDVLWNKFEMFSNFFKVSYADLVEGLWEGTNEDGWESLGSYKSFKNEYDKAYAKKLGKKVLPGSEWDKEKERMKTTNNAIYSVIDETMEILTDALEGWMTQHTDLYEAKQVDGEARHKLMGEYDHLFQKEGESKRKASWSKYRLGKGTSPAGKNYKELLITFPFVRRYIEQKAIERYEKDKKKLIKDFVESTGDFYTKHFESVKEYLLNLSDAIVNADKLFPLKRKKNGELTKNALSDFRNRQITYIENFRKKIYKYLKKNNPELVNFESHIEHPDEVLDSYSQQIWDILHEEFQEETKYVKSIIRTSEYLQGHYSTLKAQDAWKLHHALDGGGDAFRDRFDEVRHVLIANLFKRGMYDNQVGVDMLIRLDEEDYKTSFLDVDILEQLFGQIDSYRYKLEKMGVNPNDKEFEGTLTLEELLDLNKESFELLATHRSEPSLTYKNKLGYQKPETQNEVLLEEFFDYGLDPTSRYLTSRAKGPFAFNHIIGLMGLYEMKEAQTEMFEARDRRSHRGEGSIHQRDMAIHQYAHSVRDFEKWLSSERITENFGETYDLGISTSLSTPQVLEGAIYNLVRSFEGRISSARNLLEGGIESLKDKHNILDYENEIRFDHSHFTNIHDYILHLRFDERKDIDGNEVVHTAEFQSDWDLEGRKRGFKEEQPKIKAAIEARINRGKAYIEKLNGEVDYHLDTYKKEIEQRIYQLEQTQNKVKNNREYDALRDEIKKEERKIERIQDKKKMIKDIVRSADMIAGTSESSVSNLEQRLLGPRNFYDETYSRAENAELDVEGYEGKFFGIDLGLILDYKQAEYESRTHQHWDEPVADMPFRKSWKNMALKRMLRYSVARGGRNLTWDTGATVQASIAGRIQGKEALYDKIMVDLAKSLVKKYGGSVGKTKVQSNNPIPKKDIKQIVIEQMFNEETGEQIGWRLVLFNRAENIPNIIYNDAIIYRSSPMSSDELKRRFGKDIMRVYDEGKHEEFTQQGITSDFGVVHEYDNQYQYLSHHEIFDKVMNQITKDGYFPTQYEEVWEIKMSDKLVDYVSKGMPRHKPSQGAFMSSHDNLQMKWDALARRNDSFRVIGNALDAIIENNPESDIEVNAVKYLLSELNTGFLTITDIAVNNKLDNIRMTMNPANIIEGPSRDIYDVDKLFRAIIQNYNTIQFRGLERTNDKLLELWDNIRMSPTYTLWEETEYTSEEVESGEAWEDLIRPLVNAYGLSEVLDNPEFLPKEILKELNKMISLTRKLGSKGWEKRTGIRLFDKKGNTNTNKGINIALAYERPEVRDMLVFFFKSLKYIYSGRTTPNMPRTDKNEISDIYNSYDLYKYFIQYGFSEKDAMAGSMDFQEFRANMQQIYLDMRFKYRPSSALDRRISMDAIPEMRLSTKRKDAIGISNELDEIAQQIVVLTDARLNGGISKSLYDNGKQSLSTNPLFARVKKFLLFPEGIDDDYSQYGDMESSIYHAINSSYGQEYADDVARYRQKVMNEMATVVARMVERIFDRLPNDFLTTTVREYINENETDNRKRNNINLLIHQAISYARASSKLVGQGNVLIDYLANTNQQPTQLSEEDSQRMSDEGKMQGTTKYEQSYLAEFFADMVIQRINDEIRRVAYEDGKHYNDITAKKDEVKSLDIEPNTEIKENIKDLQEQNRNKSGISNEEYLRIGKILDNISSIKPFLYGIGFRDIMFGRRVSVFPPNRVIPSIRNEGSISTEGYDDDVQEFAAKMLIQNIKNRLGVDWMVIPDAGANIWEEPMGFNMGSWVMPLLTKKVINGEEKYMSVFVTNNTNFQMWFGLNSMTLPNIVDAGFDYYHNYGFFVTDEIVPLTKDGVQQVESDFKSSTADDRISDIRDNLLVELGAEVQGNLYRQLYGYGENGFIMIPSKISFDWLPEWARRQAETKYIPPFHNITSSIDRKFSQGAFQSSLEYDMQQQGIINTQFKLFADKNGVGYSSTPNIKDVLTDYVKAGKWAYDIEDIGVFDGMNVEDIQMTSFQRDTKGTFARDIVTNMQMFLPEINRKIFQAVVRGVIRTANEGALSDYISGNASIINAKNGLYVRNAEEVLDGTFIDDKLGKKHFIHKGYAYPTEGVIGASDELFSLKMNSPNIKSNTGYLLGQGVFDIDGGYIVLDSKYNRKELKDIENYKPIDNMVNGVPIDLSIMEYLFNNTSEFKPEDFNISTEYLKNLVEIFKSNQDVKMNQNAIFVTNATFDFDYNAVREERMRDSKKLKDINEEQGAYMEGISEQEMAMLLSANKKGAKITPQLAKETIQEVYEMLNSRYKAKEISKKDMSIRLRMLVTEWKKHYIGVRHKGNKKLKYVTNAELKYFMNTPLRKKPEDYLKDVDYIVNISSNMDFREAFQNLIKPRGFISTVKNRAVRTKNIPLKQLWLDIADIDVRVFETKEEILEYAKWAKDKTVDVEELSAYLEKLKAKELEFINDDFEEENTTDINNGSVEQDEQSKIDQLKPIVTELQRTMLSKNDYTGTDDVRKLIIMFNKKLDNLSYKELMDYWKVLIKINNTKLYGKEEFNFYRNNWAKFRTELLEEGINTYWWDLMNTKTGNSFISNFLSGLGNITHYNLKQILNFMDGNTRHYSGMVVNTFTNELDRVFPIMQKKMHDLYTRINPKSKIYNLNDEDMRIVYMFGVLNQKPTFKMTKALRDKLSTMDLVKSDKDMIKKISDGQFLSPTNYPTIWEKVNNWSRENLIMSLKLSLGYEDLGDSIELTKDELKKQKMAIYGASDIKFDDLKRIRKKIFKRLGYNKKEIELDQQGKVNLLDKLFNQWKGGRELNFNQKKWLNEIREVFREISNGTHSEGKSLQYVSETYTGEPISIIEDYMPILRYAEFTKNIPDMITDKAGTSTSINDKIYMNAYSDVNVNNNFIIDRKNVIQIMNTNAHEVAMSRINQQLFYLYNEEQRHLTNSVLSDEFFNTNRGHIKPSLKNMIIEMLSNYYNRGITKSKSRLRNSKWGKKVVGVMNRNRVAFLGDFIRQTAQITSIEKAMQTMEGSVATRTSDLLWAVGEMNPTSKKYRDIQNFIQEYAPEVAYRGIVDFDLGGISRQASVRNVQRAIKTGEIASEKGIWGELYNKYQNKGFDLRNFNEWQLMTLLYWDRLAARITFISNYKNYLGQVGEDVDYRRPDMKGIEFAVQAVRETQATDNILYKPAVLQNLTTNIGGSDALQNEWGELLTQSVWAFKSFSLNEKTRLRRSINRYFNEETEGDESTFNDMAKEVTYDFMGRFLFISMKNMLYYYPYVWISQLLLAQDAGDDPDDETPEETEQKIKKLNLAKNIVQTIADYNQIAIMSYFTYKALEQLELQYHKALDPRRVELTPIEEQKYFAYLEAGALLHSIMDLTVRDAYEVQDDYRNWKFEEENQSSDAMINSTILAIDLAISMGSVKIKGVKVPLAVPGMPEIKRQLKTYINMRESQQDRAGIRVSGYGQPNYESQPYIKARKKSKFWEKLKEGSY